MDRKKDSGEHEKQRMVWRDLRRELKELAQMSREYWDGFRIERKYETRVYVDKDGIRLFQSSTIEADSPPPLGSPSPVHLPQGVYMCMRICILRYDGQGHLSV